MTITVVSPMLNEIDYVQAWCECVQRFADQVVVCDTGSTDGTLDILRDYHVEIIRHRGEGAYRGSEAEIRNRLNDAALCEWIMRLDADELIDAWKMHDLVRYLEKAHRLFVRVPLYHFWLDPKFIRARQFSHGLRGLRWHPSYQTLIHLNTKDIRWIDIPCASGIWWVKLSYKHWGKVSPRLFGKRLESPAIFHYHHCHEKSYAGHKSPDTKLSGLNCVTYLGEHPEEVRFYDWFH